MGKYFLDENETGYVVGSNGQFVYGADGTESALIAAGSKETVIDGNVEEVVLSGDIAAYTFKQTGNIINVFDALGFQVCKATLQEDADGTLFTFADGTGQAKMATGGVMTLAGATVNAVEDTPIMPVTGAAWDPAVPPTTGMNFTINDIKYPATGAIGADAAGVADVMRLTGDMDVRIDFTNPANQVKGLDLNGNGVIARDGLENNITEVASKFEVVDAHSRAPLDEFDNVHNFLGNIYFDGTGFDGDGVSTDGNIFLGGLGADQASGGIGNDFMTGGGVTTALANDAQYDYLLGGRNADFFFVDLTALDPAHGDTLDIDGGETADNAFPGSANSTQDTDWLLIEASDDDEPVQIDLGSADEDGTITTEFMNDDNGNIDTDDADDHIDVIDMENVDASGNLYGFLNALTDVKLGENGMMVNGENVGIGASAQLIIDGSADNNIIVAGFDNDTVQGLAGNDVLMGGNLNYLNNPNMLTIVNDGMDCLLGGDGNDEIAFEADSGIIDGGADTDTLWLTAKSLGTKSAADMTTDSVLRFELANNDTGGDGNTWYAGTGGADVEKTADQTNYKGAGRVTVTNMENVIATGLGAIDYDTDGSNKGELNHTSQMNFLGYNGDLDLRGTDGKNVLYASTGDDIIEGRDGDDSLSGGDGIDDFYFGTTDGTSVTSYGDGIDTIHRQKDANTDNIWDGGFVKDFGIGAASQTGSSALTVDLGTTDLASADVAMTSFTIKIAGVVFAVTDTAALAAANDAAAVAAIVNEAFNTQDAKVSAAANGNTIVVTDGDGRDISDTVSEGYLVGGVVANGAFEASAIFDPSGTVLFNDRLIYKAYEDRSDNEGIDDDGVTGSIISLGDDSYAQDRVVNVDKDSAGVVTGTRIAEDQKYDITFGNLTTEDIVTVTVNDVQYTLQVGVDVDGHHLSNEDSVDTAQTTIQSNFLARYRDFINSFMDNDTAAGQVSATCTATTLSLVQAVYTDGEQTVFMSKPTVEISNLSGGEAASSSVANKSDHELYLLGFDGSNGALNEDNVLFVGEEAANRSILATGDGGDLKGSDAFVINGGADDLFNIAHNLATDTSLTTDKDDDGLRTDETNGNFVVHGDDLLIGGTAADNIYGYSGDDRVIGSLGADVIDGGGDMYAVRTVGETKATPTYYANAYEARLASTTASNKIVESYLLEQTQNGVNILAGTNFSDYFSDTLQFEQADFKAGTKFSIALANTTGNTVFTGTGENIQLVNGGAGTVAVDNEGNGTLDGTTTFRNFEHIRTVSGTGTAVANAGQGDDTLDISALSAAAEVGISYDLTNGAGAGQVAVINDADAVPATVTETYMNIIKVDGVENVIASGVGRDVLYIDESEAAKNNRFDGGTGTGDTTVNIFDNGNTVITDDEYGDTIIYQNVFATAATPRDAEPSLTITVNDAVNTDTVEMTAGRVGTTVAVDTLVSVENIHLDSNTAQGLLENDVLDVTNITNATVNYVNGKITDGAGNVQLRVGNLYQVEHVHADGSDTVIVADASIMGQNGRSDATSTDLVIDTYLNYDLLDERTATVRRLDVDTLRTIDAGTPKTADVADVPEARNFEQFNFELGPNSDTVDYSQASDNIAVVVNFDSNDETSYVLVDGSAGTNYSDASDRVDLLMGVENVVAALGNSTIDLTQSPAATNMQIEFSYGYNPANDTVAATDLDKRLVRISNTTGTDLGNVNLLEYRDLTPAFGVDATHPVDRADAYWSTVEGSDNNETVIFTAAEYRLAHEVNLRGGTNRVDYRTGSGTVINATIDLVDNDINAWGGAAADVPTNQDDQFIISVAGEDADKRSNVDIITSYTNENAIKPNSGLTIYATTDQFDGFNFSNNLDAFSKNINYFIESGERFFTIDVAGQGNSLRLTGFESITDADSSDVYNIANLEEAMQYLTFIDPDTAIDRDTIVVTDALKADFNGYVSSSEPGFVRMSVIEVNTGMDFDRLDIRDIAAYAGGLTIVGDLADTEQQDIIVGNLANIKSAIGSGITGFDRIYLASAPAGTYDLDINAGELQNGANTRFFDFDGTQIDLSLLSGAYTVTVTDTNFVGATVVGSGGADAITGGHGTDTIQGGGGDDVLNGNFVPVVPEKLVYHLSGDNTVLTADGSSITILGQSVGIDLAGTHSFTKEIATAPADPNQVLTAFDSITDAEWQAALTAAGINEKLANVSVDTVNNDLIFTFTSGTGDVAQTSFPAAVVVGGTMIADIVDPTASATDVAVNYTPQIDSKDTFVFEATAAANGVDNIIYFNATGLVNDDTLDFKKFLGTQGDVAAAASNFAAGLDLTAAADNVGVVFNKAILSASDISITPAAGKIAIEDNSKAVVLVTGDVNGVADEVNDGYSAYYVEDTNPSATAQTFTVTKVASITNVTEFNANDLLKKVLAPVPTYKLTAPLSVNEGASAAFTLETTNLPAGTLVDYTLGGTIDAADIVGGLITGQATILADGTATINVALLADGATEGAESLTLTLDGKGVSATTTVNDTSNAIPTYSFTGVQASVNEGGATTMALVTTNVPAGTLVPYTLAGTATAADFLPASLNGTVAVLAGGTTPITIDVLADATTEGAEAFTVSAGGATSSSITINDTSQTGGATYELEALADTVNEGENATITLTTTGVAAGTEVTYTLVPGSAVTNADDFVPAALTGKVTVLAGGITPIIVALHADETTELAAETFTVTAGGESSKAITINDTSQTGGATYELEALAETVNEGENATITLTTTGVAAGTEVTYTLVPGSAVTNADDFVPAALTGKVTVLAGGITPITVALHADETTEAAPETFTVTAGGESSKAITINDTSQTSQPGDTFSLDGLGTDAVADTAVTVPELDASTGAFNYTDSVIVRGNATITGFEADDMITVSGTTEALYNDSVSFTGTDVIIVFNDGAGHLNTTTLVGVNPTQGFIFDVASFNALPVGDILFA